MSMEIGGKGVKSDINVTPLVDVVLVLLIIFMVITPLLQRGKPVQLPRAKMVSELKHGGDPILVSVTGDGRVFIDKREVSKKELADALTQEMAAAPGSPVIVKGDRAIDYKTVREVILEISKTRVVGVSLAASEIRAGEAE
ncbi:MAG TPA: biopolymer transporter ExbD [Anaeromyxobacteraceae bacterium]